MRKTALLASLLISLSVPTAAKAENSIPKPCQKYVDLAIKVGFKRHELPELFRIAYRESRCIPGNIGRNRNSAGEVTSQDWGLLQVNDYSWLRYLRDRNIIEKKEQLLNPRKNLVSALALVRYSEKEGLNKWYQWRTA